VSGFSNNAVLVFALMTSAAVSASAQENGDRSRGAFGVSLQPFSAETANRRAEVVRVAYYAPQTRAAMPPRSESVDEEPSRDPGESLQRRNGSHPTVNGNLAMLRNGVAYAPSRAPDNVKNAIWAANALRRKPYVWGGGHGSFYDRGYDCSGTVSFALHYAGLLGTPMPSSDFCRYGARGRGRWITIYSRRGHTFAVIAGLRLDTTDLRYGGDVGPRWYTEGRDTGGFEARHPVGL
jgi:cell wall-associated NlpC family hydrolase